MTALLLTLVVISILTAVMLALGVCVAGFFAEQLALRRNEEDRWIVRNNTQYSSLRLNIDAIWWPLLVHFTILAMFLLTCIVGGDFALCRLDAYLTEQHIQRVLTDPKQNGCQTLSRFRDKLTPADKAKLDSSKISLQGSEWTIWLPTNRQPSSFGADVLRAVQLPASPNVWLFDLLGQSARPRSVFSVAGQLSAVADKPDRTFELALLLAGVEELEEIQRLKKSDEIPGFGPKHFDSIRENILPPTQLPLDLVRTTYSGVLNLSILLFACFLFSLARIRHRWYMKNWQAQLPEAESSVNSTLGDRKHAAHLTAEAALAKSALTWKDFWTTANCEVLTPQVLAAAQGVKNQSDRPSCALNVIVRMLTGLSPIQYLWKNQQRSVIYQEVARIEDQAENEFAKLSPNNSERAKHYPELMTQLGFLGTIIGIILGMSSAAMTQVPSEDLLYRSMSVGEMLAGLSVAFSTTLLGLIAAMALKYFITEWAEEEERQIRVGTSVIATIFKHEYPVIFGMMRNGAQEEL